MGAGAAGVARRTPTGLGEPVCQFGQVRYRPGIDVAERQSWLSRHVQIGSLFVGNFAKGGTWETSLKNGRQSVVCFLIPVDYPHNALQTWVCEEFAERIAV